MARPPDQLGRLFRNQYAAPQGPNRDSERFRRRLLAAFMNGPFHIDVPISRQLQLQVGCDIPVTAMGPNWDRFFMNADIVDLLSSITVIYQCLARNRLAAEQWHASVGAAMREEAMDYVLDARSGVHPRVDEAFQIAKALVLECLGPDRYAAARRPADQAFRRLAETPPDTTSAVREIFEAAESVFKTVTASDRALTEANARQLLQQIVDRRYQPIDAIAQRSSAAVLSSYCDWINACHPYRHGHEAEGVIAPPLELAIVVLNAGAAYIRWITTLG